MLLARDDLLRDAAYRRLWCSVLIASIGGQVTMLALPLTAALLLHATPTQMGLLTAMEVLPFALFSLPAGVWLDRVRKLPVYLAGELVLGLGVATVPLAWALDWLRMPWLYAVGFVIGLVNTVAGSAAQIVLTQVVPRERLVEAHARNALANSSAEVAGPGLAGALIKLLGAPLALLVDALLLVGSAAILRGLKVHDPAPASQPDSAGRLLDGAFWRDLKQGLAFVRGQPLLVALASAVGAWQLCHNAATVVQILYASRSLGLSENAIGLCYAALGLGTLATSTQAHRVSQRLGPGPTMVLAFALCGLGWLLPALPLDGLPAIAAFVGMLMLWGTGAVLLFTNFLGLRQAVTPAPLLGRMTSTMRWLILLPAIPGALLGGWIGEHLGLRATLGLSGAGALLLALACWRLPVIRGVRALPAVTA